jgi:ABC-type Mn2+/Zn2+ transport system permease subunit
LKFARAKYWASSGRTGAWPTEIVAIVAALTTAVGLGALPATYRVSGESVTGWAYAAAASATVLVLARTTAPDADTLHLLYGNILAVSPGHATGLVAIAAVVGIVHLLFGGRFLLVTFDEEAARVAGVNTRLWTMSLNLTIGVTTAAAVHEIGALLTFTLLTLAPMTSLLIARRIFTAFALSAGIGTAAMCAGLAVAFHADLPPGPVSVALLAVTVVIAAIVSRWRD